MNEGFEPVVSGPGLVRKFFRAWQRDSHMGLLARLRKVIAVIVELRTARRMLRACTRVDAGARVRGRVILSNRGSMHIGKDFTVHGYFLPVEMNTGPHAKITIGVGVYVNFGTVISAMEAITIGDFVRIGQHSIIADSEWMGDVTHPGDVSPIEIGNRVWLAARVTLRPGVRIGDGSVVMSGSIVESDITAGVIAGGIPARVIRPLG